jgi:DNA-binding transcriptional LysR family regulator
VVCAAPAYLERRGSPRRPEELRDHDCLVFAAGSGADEWRFQGLPGRKAAVRVPARLRANTLDAVVAAALGGAGLVWAPSWQVSEDVASGRLKIVLGPFERPSSPIHAIFPDARPLSPKVRAFTDFLVERWAAEDGHNLAPAGEGRRVRKDKARGRGRAIRT